MNEVLRVVGSSQSALLGVFSLGVALVTFSVTRGRVIIRRIIRIAPRADTALTTFAVWTIGLLGVLCVAVAFFASPAPSVVASWFERTGDPGGTATSTPSPGPSIPIPVSAPQPPVSPVASTTETHPAPQSEPVPTQKKTPRAQGDTSPYLSNLSPSETVNAGGTNELVTANGRDYLHSVYASQNYCLSSSRTSYVDYSIGREYTTFTATIALKDTDRPDLRVRFEVFVDGGTSPSYSEEVAYGQEAAVSLPVKGVLRLRLSATFFTPKNCNEFDRAIWGDAKLAR